MSTAPVASFVTTSDEPRPDWIVTSSPSAANRPFWTPR